MGADVFTQTHPGRFELPVSAFGGQCPIHWTTDAYLISKIEVGFGELAPHGCHQFVGIGDSPLPNGAAIAGTVVFDGSDRSQRTLPERAIVSPAA